VTAPALVIFDCDGVLIDSEIIGARVFSECLNAAGFPATLEEALELGLGTNALTLTEAVAARYGRPLPPGFIERMRTMRQEAHRRELKPIRGIAELLGALHVRRCVASNTHIDHLRHALTLTRLLPFFEPHVFSASMVARGKPAPDLFLLAAERLAVPPQHCLVIEDSVSGVTGARAAGMPVIGFCGGSHCRPGHAERLAAAGCMQAFTTMAEIGAFLAAAVAPGESEQERLPNRTGIGIPERGCGKLSR